MNHNTYRQRPQAALSDPAQSGAALDDKPLDDKPLDDAALSEEPLPVEREWISLDHDGDTYLFDRTFLSSNWTCIFGDGCCGIREEEEPERSEGCCTFGAHFSDAADRKRVIARAKELTGDQWQFKDVAESVGGPVVKAEKGVWTTRVYEGACIFLNRNDFAKGPGCALHVAAMDAQANYLDWKPEVCWQVPIRLSHHVDESGHTTWTMTDWKRRDWGEGGQDFAWWCTESADAFVGPTSVIESCRSEITALVGEIVYDRLVDLLAQREGQMVEAPRRRG